MHKNTEKSPIKEVFMNTLSTEIKKQAVFKLFSLKKILTVIDVWQERSIMRHRLSQLPAYRLEDMGITEEEAFIESQKPFWEK